MSLPKHPTRENTRSDLLQFNADEKLLTKMMTDRTIQQAVNVSTLPGSFTPKKIGNMRYQIDADSSKGMKVPVTIFADEKLLPK